ncbi:MAG: protein-disulfide reductase DsbD N-terminal domain-containing protein [Odoribacter sp.]|nr:protein-disulfide reductase DsbD N-terminal domain-containing protein [Odoribacter sp.]
MIRNSLWMMVILLLWGSILQAAVEKKHLKVLYVGGSADIQTGYGTEVDPEVERKSVAERMAAFEQMLDEYFSVVKVVDGKDYRVEMSNEYDVTVFDGKLRELTPRLIERDASGKVVKYVPATYLPLEFDRPAVVLAEMGETIGRPIGLKTDWYCLCLDAHAHHFRAKHPIFQGPFSVKMTIEKRLTPEDAYHYAYYADAPIPDSLPMWQVQTKGYITDEGFRIGMVSRPWGFEDSPDAEYISSGVCAKTLDAVAIGRHGNFLHWGFSASPKYMTEEAKTVFANAVVYISQFAGQAPIARKFNDRIATREYLKELKYLATRKSWQERLVSDEKWVKEMLEEQKQVKEKQARGEKLSDMEEQSLNFTPQPPMTYEAYLKRYQQEQFDRFGMDENAYIAYYDENRNCFYGGKGSYVLEVDEDVKSLSIPNNDPRLLDKAIKLLEKGKDVEKARRILTRYTLCRFETPAEWRAWYKANKSRLFFTESGGWLFMVDTRDAGVPGNDYSVLDDEEEAAKADAAKVADASVAGISGKTDDQNPVLLAAGVAVASDGSKEVVIRMKIHPGYHTYAAVAKTDPFIATTVNIELPAGYEKAGELQRPSFKPLNQAGTTIYEGEAVFRQKVKGSGTGQVKCTVGYQCCDAHICFPPTEKEMTVEVK